MVLWGLIDLYESEYTPCRLRSPSILAIYGAGIIFGPGDQPKILQLCMHVASSYIQCKADYTAIVSRSQTAIFSFILGREKIDPTLKKK